MSPSNGDEARPLGTLKTRWASEVSGTLPLPEHPRPQMQREAWGSLNGPWEYAIQPAAQATPERWEGRILVPFPVESQLSGVQRSVGKGNRLWYRRTFSRPPLAVGQRLLLHFGAVDWHAIVWVNGRQVGEHKGGYDPFTFDMTDALADGKEQTLVVSVWDPSDEGSQPCGKQKVNPHGI
jgi:beta-galactosidase/beta-glucuronidase